MVPLSVSKFRRYNKILSNPFVPANKCDRCAHRSTSYVFVADFSIMSCAECTRLGRPCVTSSIDRLDQVTDDLSSKIEADETKVAGLLDQMARMLRQVEEIRSRIS